MFTIELLSSDPTGALVDTALTRVVKCIPQPSVEERRSAYQKASELALSNGVTSVVDFGRITPGGPPEQPWDDLNGTILASSNYFDCCRTIRLCIKHISVIRRQSLLLLLYYIPR